MLRSRSLTRYTMRVGLEHLGQSVLFWVSMTFLRSPVLAIFAIAVNLPLANVWLPCCVRRFSAEIFDALSLIWRRRAGRRTAGQAQLSVYTNPSGPGPRHASLQGRRTRIARQPVRRGARGRRLAVARHDHRPHFAGVRTALTRLAQRRGRPRTVPFLARLRVAGSNHTDILRQLRRPNLVLRPDLHRLAQLRNFQPHHAVVAEAYKLQRLRYDPINPLFISLAVLIVGVDVLAFLRVRSAHRRQHH